MSASEIATLQSRVEKLERELGDLCKVSQSVIVPIGSFAPRAIESLKPIHAVANQEDGIWVASFADANINASGDSLLEAVEMLKEMIVSAFELFEANETQLGDEPRRQLAVLREFMKRR